MFLWIMRVIFDLRASFTVSAVGRPLFVCRHIRRCSEWIYSAMSWLGRELPESKPW
jgi:hypothetical protein